MATVRQNIVVQGLSGSLGDQLTIRQDKAGRTIISAKRAFRPNHEFSDSQKQHQQSFREAAAYAQAAKDQPVYVVKAQGTPLNPYNVAVADWFHAPKILDVDLAAWSGQAGQAIRIKALDDVQVTKVTVLISDENDTLIEQGEATRADGLWWQYLTTAAAGGSAKVLASAQDLPGHIAEMTKLKY